MAVAERVVASSGRDIEITRRFVARGIGNIKRSMVKYCQASHVIPHVVLADLDHAACPIALRRAWDLPVLPQTLLFNLAVREIESWLLADRRGFAKFLGVPAIKLPALPEAVPHPKEALMSIARRSKSRRLAAELTPPVGSLARIGPLYNERLSGFVSSSWDISAAAAECPSLQRMRDRLLGFMA